MAGMEAIGFVCRSCARKGQVISSSSKMARIAIRPFSRTTRSQRAHAIPSFNQECSAEVNEMLSTIRNSHILPAYMNDAQRRLVFRKKYRSELENSPVTISIEEEDFRLAPLDRAALDGERKQLLKDALKYLILEKEWSQIFPLLEGMAKMKDAVDQTTIEKLIRKASLEGQFSVIIDALRAYDRTGLTLRDKYILAGTMRGLRVTAEVGDWSQKSLVKAIKYAENVGFLLADKRHMALDKIPRREAATVKGNPMRSPLNIAVWLELHAVKAHLYDGGKDVEDKVQKLYKRLVACFDMPKTPKWLEGDNLDISTQFFRLLPMWQGVLLSTKLLEAGVTQGSEELQQFANLAGESLSRTVARLREQGEHKAGSLPKAAIEQYELARKHIHGD